MVHFKKITINYIVSHMSSKELSTVHMVPPSPFYSHNSLVRLIESSWHVSFMEGW